jgi:hypothetical protein
MSGGIVSNSDILTPARKLLNPRDFEVMCADAIREGDRHFFGSVGLSEVRTACSTRTVGSGSRRGAVSAPTRQWRR